MSTSTQVPVPFQPAEEAVAVKKPRKPRRKNEKFQLTVPKLIYESKDGSVLYVRMPVDDNTPRLVEELREAVPGIYPGGYEYVKTGKKTPEGLDEKVSCVRYYIMESLDTLQAVHRFGRSHRFTFDGDISVRAQMQTEDGRELLRMSDAKSNSTIEIPKLGGTLRPFQRAGVAYLLKAKKAFLADEMGIGKTIQAIAAWHTAKAYPVLIVCPASIKINWYREVRKWLPRSRKVKILGKNSLVKTVVEKDVMRERRKALKDLAQADILIINYDRLHVWLDWLCKIEFKALVFDESHYIRGQSRLRTRSAKSLIDAVDPEYLFMLTGTPAMNNPKELMGQLATIGRLGDFGGRGHFIRTYCGINKINSMEMKAAGDNDLRDKLIRKSHEALIKLNEQLKSICYVRRTKADVLHDLPAKQRTTVMLDIDNRAEYKKVEEDVISWLGARAAKDEKFLKSIRKLDKDTREQMIRDYRSTIEFKSARAEALVRINYCKQVAALGKMAESIQWIKDAMEDGEKMVVFAVHKAVIERLQEEFPDALHILSGDSDEKRQMAIDEFKSNPQEKLIIISLKIGGVGIDGLQGACSRGVFLELGWNPGTHDQAEDRLHRIGQTESVNWYYHLARKTIEERIAALIEKKRLTINAVSDGNPMKDMEQGSILGELIYELVGKDIKL